MMKHGALLDPSQCLDPFTRVPRLDAGNTSDPDPEPLTVKLWSDVSSSFSRCFLPGFLASPSLPPSLPSTAKASFTYGPSYRLHGVGGSEFDKHRTLHH